VEPHTTHRLGLDGGNRHRVQHLVGYGEHRIIWFLLVLPAIVSISFFLIADIDSPRTGLIRNLPQNLIAQQAQMKPE